MPAKKKRVKSAKAKSKKLSAAEACFIDDLVITGKAVKKTSASQKLPPGATHWLVEDEKTGVRTVKRARFSIC